jgi:hypothetical protein
VLPGVQRVSGGNESRGSQYSGASTKFRQLSARRKTHYILGAMPKISAGLGRIPLIRRSLPGEHVLLAGRFYGGIFSNRNSLAFRGERQSTGAKSTLTTRVRSGLASRGSDFRVAVRFSIAASDLRNRAKAASFLAFPA